MSEQWYLTFRVLCTSDNCSVCSEPPPINVQKLMFISIVHLRLVSRNWSRIANKKLRHCWCSFGFLFDRGINKYICVSPWYGLCHIWGLLVLPTHKGHSQHEKGLNNIRILSALAYILISYCRFTKPEMNRIEYHGSKILRSFYWIITFFK